MIKPFIFKKSPLLVGTEFKIGQKTFTAIRYELDRNNKTILRASQGGDDGFLVLKGDKLVPFTPTSDEPEGEPVPETVIEPEVVSELEGENTPSTTSEDGESS